MTHTVQEVLDFVRENDVQFIRLGFCDLLGVQKNISIMPTELSSAFENGISFDAHAVKGFREVTESDLLLFPDPATLTVLPWRPGPGRVIRLYCDIKNPDNVMCDDCNREYKTPYKYKQHLKYQHHMRLIFSSPKMTPCRYHETNICMLNNFSFYY